MVGIDYISIDAEGMGCCPLFPLSGVKKGIVRTMGRGCGYNALSGTAGQTAFVLTRCVLLGYWFDMLKRVLVLL